MNNDRPQSQVVASVDPHPVHRVGVHQINLQKRRIEMSALSEALINFLLAVLLPWVIQLMSTAVDKYLRPYATQEGFDALTHLFQKFYDDAAEKGRDLVQTFIATIISPIFKINIITEQPIQPVAGLKLLASVAGDLYEKDKTVPFGWNWTADRPYDPSVDSGP
jgi:hypothetical protein